jgi:hypothetical protein
VIANVTFTKRYLTYQAITCYISLNQNRKQVRDKGKGGEFIDQIWPEEIDKESAEMRSSLLGFFRHNKVLHHHLIRHL